MSLHLIKSDESLDLVCSIVIINTSLQMATLAVEIDERRGETAREEQASFVGS